MICVIDFDGTFFKNDFFKEAFFRKLIRHPFFIFQHFFLRRGSLLQLKQLLLSELVVDYNPSLLINPAVLQWIETNKNKYDKIVVVSASPLFFVQKIVAPLQLFHTIDGSINLNLKGKAKLDFIIQKWGDDFDYMGDSKADEPIFAKAKHAIRVQELNTQKNSITKYCKLIRPRNWIKNGIIFMPFLLSGNYQLHILGHLFVGFICFSLIASGCYILNDLLDIENDRRHPLKQKRPLAAADIAVGSAVFFALLLVGIGLALSAIVAVHSTIILLGYLGLNYFYSVFGKKIRFFDMLLLCSFYLIRIFYGASISATPLTGWFVATLTLSILALCLNKRYLECRLSTNANIAGRKYYKEDAIMLQHLMYNFAMAAIVLLNVHAYFVLAIQSPYFFFLMNIAAAAILFFYFDSNENISDDPVEKIISNKPLLVTLVLFIMLYIYEINAKFI